MTVADRPNGAAARRRVELSADTVSLKAARRFADAVAAREGFGHRERYELMLACNEAVANAVEHGSRTGDRVLVEAGVEGDSLVIRVRDRGRFVPRVRPRVSTPERGRGLEFMTELVDDVQLHTGPSGTDVVLRKRLPGR